MKRKDKTNGASLVNEPSMAIKNDIVKYTVNRPATQKQGKIATTHSTDEWYDRSSESPEYQAWINAKLQRSLDEALNYPERCTVMTIKETHGWVNSLFDKHRQNNRTKPTC